jgi:hypothetical protein
VLGLAAWTGSNFIIVRVVILKRSPLCNYGCGAPGLDVGRESKFVVFVFRF